MKRNHIYSSFIAMLATLILLLGIMALPASAQTVSELQAAIKASGASWVAGDNPISRLAPQQQKQLLGVVNPPRSATSAAPTCQPSAVGLPVSLDWRNNGGNYVTSVKNQGGCGSCWAFSAVATLESATLIYNKTPNTSLDLSEQVLISCCDATCSPYGQCGGGWPSKAADFLRDNGAPADSCYTYVGNGSCSSACPNWKASAYKIKSWEWVVNYDQSEKPTVDKIRAGLQNGPLAIAFAVYSDFFSYTSGIYKHVSGGLAGYHAVLVVGYDDASQYFIVKNSWATTWGESGFFKIAYSEVTGDSQLGYMTLAYHVGDSPNPPTCEYPLSEYFTASGGTGNVQVATEAGCAWSATSNAGWINITSGSSGSGPGAVTYTVAPNTASSRRTGTMTVPGGTFTVLQELGSGQCTYSLSATGNTFTSAGGSGSVNVSAGSGCSWTATSSNTSWLAVTSGSSGTGNGTVNYTVQPNTTSTSRTATISIANQTFTVTQPGGGSCTYSISPTSVGPVPSVGYTGSVAVTAGAGCTWTVTSNTSWVTVTGGSSGTGNGTVNYSVAPNTDGPQRTATVTIAGQTFTVIQSYGCSWSISPNSQSFTSAAGTGTIAVCAGSGCAWTATSSAPSWLTVTGGANGPGNGTVSYSVAANNTGAARSGTITGIAAMTHTVTQAAGGGSCTYSISPTSVGPVPSVGYTGSVAVTAGAGCTWTVTSNTSWVTVTGGSSGTGNGTVNYSVAPNTDGPQRTATVTIAGQTFTVIQSYGCSWSISPNSQSFTSAAGTGTIAVYAGSGCAWTATSSAPSWLTVTSGGNGPGNGTLNYSVVANTGAARSGTITGIGGLTHTVTQAGVTTCSVSLGTGGFNFGYLSRQGTIPIQAASTCAWSASASAPWITFNSGATGKGSGTAIFTLDTNTGAARTGTISINGTIVTVNQAGSTTCTYAITPTSQSLGAASGTGTVSVTSASGCAWSAASNAPWISLNSGSSGSGNGSVTYTVQANAGSSRTGTMTIAGQTFTVSQAGGTTCTYSISPTSQSFTAASGTSSVNVTSASGCAWTASSNAAWISITGGASGSGSGTVSYSVGANTGTSRTGTLTIAGQMFTVSQAGTAPTCSVSTSTGGFNVGYTARQLNIPVQASSICSWSASTNVPWISFISGATGKGNGTVTFSASTNTGSARTGTVTVNGTTTVTVNQAGAPGK